MQEPALSKPAVLTSECSWLDLFNRQPYMLRGILLIFNANGFMSGFGRPAHGACSSHVALLVDGNCNAALRKLRGEYY